MHQLKEIACADIVIVHSVACEIGYTPVNKIKRRSRDLGYDIEIGRINIIILFSVLAVGEAFAEIEEIFYILCLACFAVGHLAGIIEQYIVAVLCVGDSFHVYIQPVFFINLGLYYILAVFHYLRCLNIEDIIEYGGTEAVVIEIICRGIYHFIRACGIVCRFRILGFQLKQKRALSRDIAEDIEIVYRSYIRAEIVAYRLVHKNGGFALENGNGGTQRINNILSALYHAVVGIAGGNRVADYNLIRCAVVSRHAKPAVFLGILGQSVLRKILGRGVFVYALHIVYLI